MQLFITDFKQNWNDIIIANPEILEQTRKVLRMKIWDIFFVQKENRRYEIEISDRDKTTIAAKILNTQNKLSIINYQLSIIISMPNKRPKAELIVQKLSEIGVDNIYFRTSERSILKNRNDKKIERLHKISQEALEQSRWRTLPKIEFIKDISKTISNQKVIVFDKSDKFVSLSSWSVAKDIEKQNILWIIGPEWWLTPNDYQKFGDKYEIISLWDTVLRMETASIIGAWLLKNLLKK